MLGVDPMEASLKVDDHFDNITPENWRELPMPYMQTLMDR